METSKILVIVGIVLILLIPVIVILLFPPFRNNILLKIQAKAELPKAERKAVAYIKKKYGETPDILSSEPLSVGVSWKLFERMIYAYKININGYSVIVEGETVVDDRQYEEICAAVTDKYFDDKRLGSSFTVNHLSVGFPGEIIRHGEYTSAYFDGDIEKFIAETDPAVRISVTYEGYSEKRGEYRQLISDKFTELNNAVKGLTMSVFIHDPELDLPKMSHKANDSSSVWSAPKYEEYMELIACGISEKDGAAIYQTGFYEIDKYTAVSDDVTPIISKDEITFEPVDLSDNTTAYRMLGYDSKKDRNAFLTTRSDGWRIELADRKLYNILLRLDRKHYGIKDSTIPVLVSDVEKVLPPERLKETHRFYTSVGYGAVSADGHIAADTRDWYYLDDEYLYLWIYSYPSNLSNEWYLTFSDTAI